MATLTIDGKEYDTESLSDEAKKQFEAIQFTQVEIARLERQIAVLQTARSTYGLALKELVERNPEDTDSQSIKQMPSSISFD